MTLDVSPVELELISARAWPSARQAKVGGWRLHAAHGVSNRINSCWPIADPGLAPECAISAAETWYADQRLPCVFKLAEGATWPPDLGDHLSRRGYSQATLTAVMTGLVIGVLDPEAIMLDDADGRFGGVFAAARPGAADALERMEALARVPYPRALVLMEANGGPAAIGACAIEQSWVGLFAMRTLPAVRRQGFARRVLGSLLAHAGDQGARRAWLQVEVENHAAVALYEQAGFVEAYRYGYWRRPA